MRLFGWRRIGIDDVIARWPALAAPASDERVVLAALYQLRAEQDATHARRDFLAAEPLLERLLHGSSAQVRRAALDAWATILEGRVRRAHVDLLFDLSSEPDLDPLVLEGAIRAALSFGDEEGRITAALVENSQSSTRKNQHLR